MSNAAPPEARAAALMVVLSLAMAGIAGLPAEDAQRSSVAMVQCLYVLGVSVDELEAARTKYQQTADVLSALRDLG